MKKIIIEINRKKVLNNEILKSQRLGYLTKICHQLLEEICDEYVNRISSDKFETYFGNKKKSLKTMLLEKCKESYKNYNKFEGNSCEVFFWHEMSYEFAINFLTNHINK